MISEEAVLIWTTNEKDGDGFPSEVTTELPVYVREKSVTRLEFYEAYRSGITASMMFEVRMEDWIHTKHQTTNGKTAYADRIRYDGTTYDIVRNYRNDKSMVQLTCS